MNTTATPWDPHTLHSWDVRRFVPADVIETINTPHSHEGDGNRPLWIIWTIAKDHPPTIDTICDTADSAIYHYGAVVEGNPTWIREGKITVHVERVPANHRFASSISHLVFEQGAYGKIKVPRRYRSGD